MHEDVRGISAAGHDAQARRRGRSMSASDLEPEPEPLQECMDAVDAERAAEAAPNRRPGSKTTEDSSRAERFKPRCAVGQPTPRKTARHSPLGRLAAPTDRQTASYEAGRPR
jgi:hypothetical protein